MSSIHKNLNPIEQRSGIVLLFKPKLVKEQPKPCIFCGDTVDLQIFKGQSVCSACLQNIPSLFNCS